MDGLGFLCETVIGATAFLQHFHIPAMVVTQTGATQDLFDFFWIEETQAMRLKHWIKSYMENEAKAELSGCKRWLEMMIDNNNDLPSRMASNWICTPSLRNQCVIKETYWCKLCIVTEISRPSRRSSMFACPGNVKFKPKSAIGHPS